MLGNWGRLEITIFHNIPPEGSEALHDLLHGSPSDCVAVSSGSCRIILRKMKELMVILSMNVDLCHQVSVVRQMCSKVNQDRNIIPLITEGFASDVEPKYWK